MMKSFAVTLLVTTATMIGTAHAASQEDLDRYTACMISEAKASLKNNPGDQVAAYDHGARLCRVPYDATDEEVDGMGDYVELKIMELAAQASETEELETAGARRRRPTWIAWACPSRT